jgi:ribosomal protein S18 acetylase RimI-like enzyme
MDWKFTDEAEVFASQAHQVLVADPAKNTITLTVLENIRAGKPSSSTLFGWYDDGSARGAVSFTPPHDLVLSVVPADSVEPLVAGLRSRSVSVPGVRGEQPIAELFAASWAKATGTGWHIQVRQRLYELGSLVSPDDVLGRARRAGEADLAIGTRFFAEFQAECHDSGDDPQAVIRDRVEAGVLWLWENDGEVTSMAARNRIAAGVARVGPVYTPPNHRRYGYAAAVTAACSADAARAGATQVVLYTDLANPTSNAIYQRLGYRAVCDEVVIAFGAP